MARFLPQAACKVEIVMMVPIGIEAQKYARLIWEQKRTNQSEDLSTSTSSMSDDMLLTPVPQTSRIPRSANE